jgi:urease accessory protein UreE
MNRSQRELLSREKAEIILSHPSAMKHGDILVVYEAGPEVVIKLVNSLTDTITKL